jgi:hypothetical protein
MDRFQCPVVLCAGFTLREECGLNLFPITTDGVQITNFVQHFSFAFVATVMSSSIHSACVAIGARRACLALAFFSHCCPDAPRWGLFLAGSLSGGGSRFLDLWAFVILDANASQAHPSQALNPRRGNQTPSRAEKLRKRLLSLCLNKSGHFRVHVVYF